MLKYYVNLLILTIPIALLLACSGGSEGGSTTAGEAGFSVNRVTPESGSKGISVNTSISVWFNKEIDPNGYDTKAAITLLLNGQLIDGQFQQDGSMLTFNPSISLENGKSYTVVVQSGIKSTDGSVLADDFVWSFETTDPIASYLKISSVTPQASNIEVSPNSQISVLFEEPLDPTTYGNAILVQTDNQDVPGNTSLDTDRLIFTPTIPFSKGKKITVTIRKNLIRGLQGTQLLENYVWNFTTAAPQSCVFENNLIGHENSLVAYLEQSVEAGNSCQSETRICNDGSLSGSYPHSTCGIAQIQSCQFNGKELEEGESVRAYQQTEMAYGEVCQSQLRLCTNGILSGSYLFANCSVAEANTCNFNGETIPSGNSVIAYQNSSVNDGESCKAEYRVCTNGILSGSYSYSDCSIASNSRFSPTQSYCDDICEGLIAYFPFKGNAADALGNLPQGVVDGATLTSDRDQNAQSAYLFEKGTTITFDLNNYVEELNKILTIVMIIKVESEVQISVTNSWVVYDVLNFLLGSGRIELHHYYPGNNSKYYLTLHNPLNQVAIQNNFVDQNYDQLVVTLNKPSNILQINIDGESAEYQWDGVDRGVFENLTLGFNYVASQNSPTINRLGYTIDEFRIYNRELSTQETRTLMKHQ